MTLVDSPRRFPCTKKWGKPHFMPGTFVFLEGAWLRSWRDYVDGKSDR